MFDMFLTLAQTLQMMTLAPCILVIVYLLISCHEPSSVVIPILYFIALACGLLLPLLPVLIPVEKGLSIYTVLKLGESFGTALSYLFIVQLILNRYPGFIHHLILAVPAIGGSSYIYASQLSEIICITPNACLASSYAVTFYNIFSSSFIFMLLTIFNSHNGSTFASDDIEKKNQYWLILSLIIFNLMLLALDLLKVSSQMQESVYTFAQSAIRLAFIYIVLTSIFRVFTQLFHVKASVIATSPKKTTLSPVETETAKRIEDLMVNDKLYTDLNFSRSKFATLLNIKDHQLSTIINLAFNKSFSEFINHYRIEEAKRLLKESKQPITVISFDTGFNSLTSFNRVFKESTQLSPTEFRQAYEK